MSKKNTLKSWGKKEGAGRSFFKILHFFFFSMANRAQAIRKTKIENLMNLTNQIVDIKSALLPSHDALSPVSPMTPGNSPTRKKRSILIGNFQSYVGTPLFRSSSIKLNKKNEEDDEKLEDYFQKLDSEFPLKRAF